MGVLGFLVKRIERLEMLLVERGIYVGRVDVFLVRIICSIIIFLVGFSFFFFIIVRIIIFIYLVFVFV